MAFVFVGHFVSLLSLEGKEEETLRTIIPSNVDCWEWYLEVEEEQLKLEEATDDLVEEKGQACDARVVKGLLRHGFCLNINDLKIEIMLCLLFVLVCRSFFLSSKDRR